MSHDIRTPMNAIMGMTTLASAYLGDDERVAGYLDKIEVSSRHLLSLINDILDMSKIERAQITLNLSKVSIPKLLDQLSVMILSQAEEAGLTLSIRAEGVNHEDFYGDPLRINQILINLLSNAVKFANKGGMVELLAEEVETEGSAGRVSYHLRSEIQGSACRRSLFPKSSSRSAAAEMRRILRGQGLVSALQKD